MVSYFSLHVASRCNVKRHSFNCAGGCVGFCVSSCLGSRASVSSQIIISESSAHICRWFAIMLNLSWSQNRLQRHRIGYLFWICFRFVGPISSLGVDFEIQEVYTTSTHQGWALLGYTMAWRPTVEGTVKKGLMRIVGTALGKFLQNISLIL